MHFRGAASALALIVLTVGARPASAESAPDQNAARERFKQGAQAYSEGRYKDAIDLFLDADRLAPNPAFAYNIGLGYEELGDAPNALRWYRSYLRDLPGAPDQAEVAPRIAAAERHLSERGVQQVTVLSSPEGATVSIDGDRVGVAPWTAELPPGTHELGLELRGFADSSASFELPREHAMDVAVVLKRLPDPTVVSVLQAGPPDPGHRDTRPTPSRVRPITWATLGVGVATLGAAVGLELTREGAVDSARESPTNLAGKEEYDRARTYETAAKVCVGVGGAITALAGVLFYVDLSSSSSRATGMAGMDAVLGCGGPGCGVRLNGSF